MEKESSLMRVFIRLFVFFIFSIVSVEAQIVHTETRPPSKQAAAVLTAAAIAALIVKDSRDQYYATGHPCACPDDVTRNGRSCGNMSAYVRPGGAHPLCSPADVTAGMIDDYRKTKIKGGSQ
jgi:hypothetical protein